MKRALFVAGVLLGLVSTDAAAQMRMDVGPNTDATYVKECGGCHFAYQPGWLPEPT